MLGQKLRQLKRRNVLLTIVLIVLGLLVIGFLVLPKPVLAIPKPTGENEVGFSNLTLTDDSRTLLVNGQSSPRVLTLDIWYPAQTTEGFTATPYTEHALNVALSKYQGIPLWLNKEVPSYSFVDAPPLTGKHPVVVFNHGFASFSKQNFSNFQELASHGYLVISVAHPGESLISKDAEGNVLELDTQQASYQAAINLQKDVKTIAPLLASIYAKQRSATTREDYQQASIALTQTPYFAPMKPQVQSWVADTEFVIAELKKPQADILNVADTQHITVMGHSLGGAVALELAKNPPNGVTGIINLDGPHLQYEPENTRSFQVPVLNFLSTQFVMEKQDIGLHGTLQHLFRERSSGAYILEIAGTAHNNFTDLNFTPVLKYFTPLLGEVDNAEIASYVNQAIVEFIKRIENNETLGQPLLPETKEIKQEFIDG
jgi:pimeloyl-ACP methyl ester carboxylesterase